MSGKKIDLRACDDKRILNLLKDVSRLMQGMDESTRMKVRQELEMITLENARYLDQLQDSEPSKVH